MHTNRFQALLFPGDPQKIINKTYYILRYQILHGCINMSNDLNVKNGKLIIQQVSFKRLLVRNVMKNDPSGSQGKIALPKNLIGKEVYVILEV